MNSSAFYRDTLKKVLLLLLLALAVIRFALLPARDLLLKEKLVYEGSVQKLHQKKIQLERAKEEITKGNGTAISDQNRIPHYVYPKDSDPFEIQLSLLKDFIKVLQDKNLTLQNFSFPEISYGRTLTEIPLELQFQGRIADVISFFNYLEKKEKRIFIRDCSITESARRLSVSLTLTVIKSEI